MGAWGLSCALVRVLRYVEGLTRRYRWEDGCADDCTATGSQKDDRGGYAPAEGCRGSSAGLVTDRYCL